MLSEWQSQHVPYTIRRPWIVFQEDVEWKFTREVREEGNDQGDAKRLLDQLMAVGAKAAFRMLSKEEQLSYTNVSLTELAAFVCWQQDFLAGGRAATGPIQSILPTSMNAGVDIAGGGGSMEEIEEELRKIWDAQDVDTKAQWIPEDPLAILAQNPSRWAPLLKAAGGEQGETSEQQPPQSQQIQSQDPELCVKHGHDASTLGDAPLVSERLPEQQDQLQQHHQVHQQCEQQPLQQPQQPRPAQEQQQPHDNPEMCTKHKQKTSTVVDEQSLQDGLPCGPPCDQQQLQHGHQESHAQQQQEPGESRPFEQPEEQQHQQQQGDAESHARPEPGEAALQDGPSSREQQQGQQQQRELQLQGQQQKHQLHQQQHHTELRTEKDDGPPSSLIKRRRQQLQQRAQDIHQCATTASGDEPQQDLLDAAAATMPAPQTPPVARAGRALSTPPALPRAAASVRPKDSVRHWSPVRAASHALEVRVRSASRDSHPGPLRRSSRLRARRDSELPAIKLGAIPDKPVATSEQRSLQNKEQLACSTMQASDEHSAPKPSVKKLRRRSPSCYSPPSNGDEETEHDVSEYEHRSGGRLQPARSHVRKQQIVHEETDSGSEELVRKPRRSLRLRVKARGLREDTSPHINDQRLARDGRGGTMQRASARANTGQKDAPAKRRLRKVAGNGKCSPAKETGLAPQPACSSKGRLRGPNGEAMAAGRKAQPAEVTAPGTRLGTEGVARARRCGADVGNVFCCICGGTEATDDNDLALCDGCRIGFHRQCHHPPPIDFGDSDEMWFCASCVEGLAQTRQLKYRPGDLVRARKFAGSELRMARVLRLDFTSPSDPRPYWVEFLPREQGVRCGDWLGPELIVGPWGQQMAARHLHSMGPSTAHSDAAGQSAGGSSKGRGAIRDAPSPGRGNDGTHQLSVPAVGPKTPAKKFTKPSDHVHQKKASLRTSPRLQHQQKVSDKASEKVSPQESVSASPADKAHIPARAAKRRHTEQEEEVESLERLLADTCAQQLRLEKQLLALSSAGGSSVGSSRSSSSSAPPGPNSSCLILRPPSPRTHSSHGVGADGASLVVRGVC